MMEFNFRRFLFPPMVLAMLGGVFQLFGVFDLNSASEYGSPHLAHRTIAPATPAPPVQPALASEPARPLAPAVSDPVTDAPANAMIAANTPLPSVPVAEPSPQPFNQTSEMQTPEWVPTANQEIVQSQVEQIDQIDPASIEILAVQAEVEQLAAAGQAPYSEE